MDLAASVKYYAKKQGLGKEAITYANSIEVSAEIRLGEFLMEMEKNKGAQGKGNPRKSGKKGNKEETRKSAINIVDGTPPTLKEMGISLNLSSEAQSLASLPEEDKEKLKAGKMAKKKVNKYDVINKLTGTPMKVPSPS